MTWHAKPSGGYAIGSTEFKDNVNEISALLYAQGFTREAIGGVIANMQAESGLNPWRWQANEQGVEVVNYNAGYGLFQFTPARDYINDNNLANHAPNLSVTSITTGAKPSDGIGQTFAMYSDRYDKWVWYCWRDYWSTSSYPSLSNLRYQILTKYGDGSHLSLNQYKIIDDLYSATFAFLACYEGPLYPNMTARWELAQQIIGFVPIKGKKKRKMPIYMMMKPRRNSYYGGT